ncbi:MAG: tetraacyldisaccharide 4'-kinase [Candidatus Hydrogenedentes bacterium]|nr:tetraacyldisaccharide 4'-kinase [Candidatus Hydrogenedentota bacterium]
MNPVDPLIRKIRTGEPIPAPLAAILTAATPIQRVGMWLRHRKPRERVNARVISFGNITAGGTGKTPAVIERASKEVAEGRVVGILTRGHGHTRKVASIVIARGEEAAHMSDVIGDEPALIASKVPDAFVARSADRVAAARKLIDEHGCDTLILDDGFQYVQLERDENIALIDASNPFGNERLVPRGILREPVSALARATQLILTRCDQARDLDALLRRIESICPGIPIRKTYHAPVRLRRVCDGETMSLKTLKDDLIAVACAIGNPESFLRTLQDIGAKPYLIITNLDHASLPLEKFSEHPKVIVTEKDATRIRTAPSNVWALEVELRDC